MERGTQARGGAAAAAGRGGGVALARVGRADYKLEQWRAKAEAALDGALKEREGEPANIELAAALQAEGKLFETSIYPGMAHVPRGSHIWLTQFDFFKRRLAPRAAQGQEAPAAGPGAK